MFGNSSARAGVRDQGEKSDRTTGETARKQARLVEASIGGAWRSRRACRARLPRSRFPAALVVASGWAPG
jgi:hypothetical protein